MNSTPRTTALRPVRWTVMASHVIAIAMAICFANTAVLTAQRFFLTWNARGLPIVCALVAVESVFSYRLLKHSLAAQRQTIYYRLTEWALILIALKLFTELRGGPQALWNNILHWPLNFPYNVVTGEYFLNLLLVYGTWQISTLFATDLYLLEVDEAVHIDERLVKSPLRNLILHRFLTIGMVVVLLAGLTIENVWLPRQVGSQGVIPAALLYFLFGMGLVSITHYASLESSWRQAQVRVPSQIPGQWVLYSFIILVLLTVLSIWLPTNYGLGFASTIKSFLQLIWTIIVYIFTSVMFLLGLWANLLGRLLGNKPPPDQIEATPQSPFVPSTPSAGPSIWEIIKSVLFWGVLLTLVFVVLRQYIIFNQDFLDELKNFRLLRWLASFWKRLRTSLSKANQSMGSFLRRGIQRLRSLRSGSTESEEWNYVNLRRLSPRQKIIFYYLALLKRAGEAGLPRREVQTPYEYAQSLGSHMDEGKGEVETMTESFVEARYSNHAISTEKARRAESLSERLRRILRLRRKARQAEKSPSTE